MEYRERASSKYKELWEKRAVSTNEGPRAASLVRFRPNWATGDLFFCDQTMYVRQASECMTSIALRLSSSA